MLTTHNSNVLIEEIIQSLMIWRYSSQNIEIVRNSHFFFPSFLPSFLSRYGICHTDQSSISFLQCLQSLPESGYLEPAYGYLVPTFQYTAYFAALFLTRCYASCIWLLNSLTLGWRKQILLLHLSKEPCLNYVSNRIQEIIQMNC